MHVKTASHYMWETIRVIEFSCSLKGVGEYQGRRFTPAPSVVDFAYLVK